MYDEFSDIVVAPYSDLLDTPHGGTHHRGGPIWRDWSANNPHRYHKGGAPTDVQPEDPGPVETTCDEVVYWAGACCDHFGHQIVDFSSKLATYRAIMQPGEKILVATKIKSGFVSFDTLPEVAKLIYQYFGFGENDIMVISKPTRFMQLRSIPQQEQHGGGRATPHHLALLEKHAFRSLPGSPRRVRRYYVSRSSVGDKAGIAAERIIEECLRDIGFTVMHPERLPLIAQLDAYNSALELVFSEGSALHGLQLLGPIRAGIRVLTRRPGSRMLEPNLAQRTDRLSYTLLGNHFIHGVEASGKPAVASGLLLPEADRLAAFLRSASAGGEEVAVDPERLRGAVEADLAAYLEREAESRRGGVPATRERINAQLERAGFAHLRM